MGNNYSNNIDSYCCYKSKETIREGKDYWIPYSIDFAYNINKSMKDSKYLIAKFEYKEKLFEVDILNSIIKENGIENKIKFVQTDKANVHLFRGLDEYQINYNFNIQKIGNITKNLFPYVTLNQLLHSNIKIKKNLFNIKFPISYKLIKYFNDNPIVINNNNDIHDIIKEEVSSILDPKVFEHIKEWFNYNNCIADIVLLIYGNDNSIRREIRKVIETDNISESSLKFYFLLLHASLIYGLSKNSRRINTLYKGVFLKENDYKVGSNIYINDNIFVSIDPEEEISMLMYNKNRNIDFKPYLIEINNSDDKFKKTVSWIQRIPQNEIQPVLLNTTIYRIENIEYKTNYTLLKLNVNQKNYNHYSYLFYTSNNNIDLSYTKIGVEGAKYISEAIKLNNSINNLNLSYNNIGPEGAKYISEAIKFYNSIHNLNLSSNSIGVEGALYISETIKSDNRINNINLSENYIRVEGAKYISEAIKTNISINNLNLSSNNIGVEGAKYISEAIKLNNSINNLDISNNEIGDEAAEFISEAFKSNYNSNINNLILSCNNIRVEGTKYISEAIKSINSIKNLDLSNNNIRVEGAKYISEAIRFNNSINNLNLRNNELGDEGAKYISEAIKSNNSINNLDNNSINNLDLSFNKLGVEAAEFISEAIKSNYNSNINNLNLSINYIGSEGAKYISEAIKSNNNINNINLSQNYIGDEGVKYISEAKLTRNSYIFITY